VLLVLASAVVLSGCSATRPQPHPAHSAQPSGPADKPAGPAPAMNPFLLQVPGFPPAPEPVPVRLNAAGGLAPFLSRVPTGQRVAFLTIDDGITRLPEALALMQAANIPFTMFLTSGYAAADPGFFRSLTRRGGVIADHTIDHPSLRGKSYEFQRHQLCASAQRLNSLFGAQPRLFRPPYGEFDATTRRAAHDCGFTAVLNWSETVDHGRVAYQTAQHVIRPGDIILMHFRPAFVADVLAALNAIHAAGLTPAVLSDYLPAPAAQQP
jgi:peptidoglycan/xylan/chitin deacetylase (PgdA/CDA1 family)